MRVSSSGDDEEDGQEESGDFHVGMEAEVKGGGHGLVGGVGCHIRGSSMETLFDEVIAEVKAAVSEWSQPADAVTQLLSFIHSIDWTVQKWQVYDKSEIWE